MWNLITSGGLMFTLPLLLLLLVILALAAKQSIASNRTATGTRLLLHLGIFSAVLGILGQAMGLYQAMGVIQSVGGVSPAMLAGGIKISFIAPILGLVNLAVAVAVFAALRFKDGP